MLLADKKEAGTGNLPEPDSFIHLFYIAIGTASGSIGQT